ncbi:Lrp/AsnC family transcriptional regulator [Candidatus Sumerlaeota bacterium]|nr:Lrp/AsnC family transcriptional regulator [Candidatus Sumerlaeota bacterium]
MKKVLTILQKDGRAEVTDISKRVNADAKDVRQAMAELQKTGVIMGYQAIVNPDKTGDDSVLSLIEVCVTPQRDIGFDAIARRIYKFPEVKTCYLVSGAYDLLLVVEGDSLRQVATFVAEKLATLDHVQSTRTHFLLRKYKEHGVALQAEEEPERLAITP